MCMYVTQRGKVCVCVCVSLIIVLCPDPAFYEIMEEYLSLDPNRRSGFLLILWVQESSSSNVIWFIPRVGSCSGVGLYLGVGLYSGVGT